MSTGRNRPMVPSNGLVQWFAEFAQASNEGDYDQAIEPGNAGHGDEADAGGDRQGECDDPARQSQRHATKDDGCILGRAEGHEEQAKDHSKRCGHTGKTWLATRDRHQDGTAGKASRCVGSGQSRLGMARPEVAQLTSRPCQAICPGHGGVQSVDEPVRLRMAAMRVGCPRTVGARYPPRSHPQASYGGTCPVWRRAIGIRRSDMLAQGHRSWRLRTGSAAHSRRDRQSAIRASMGLR